MYTKCIGMPNFLIMLDHGTDVMNKFYSSVNMLDRNKAVSFDVPSHVIIFNQSKCIISAYAIMLSYVDDIDFRHNK